MYKRYWKIWMSQSGFDSLMLMYGTEEEIHEYMIHEIGHMPRYIGATDEEVEMAKKLGIKVYLA